MFVCPVMAAALLQYGEHRTAGVIELLKRSFDYDRIGAKGWYLPLLLRMPRATLMTYGLLRMRGLPLSPRPFTLSASLAMFLLFFGAGPGEELGWSRYTLEPMQARWHALQAGILLGVVWAGWHRVPLVQAHRSAGWVAW